MGQQRLDGFLDCRLVFWRAGGLKGKDSIAELCRREGIAQSLYYSWSKEFLEAGKKRLAGDIPSRPSQDHMVYVTMPGSQQ